MLQQIIRRFLYNRVMKSAFAKRLKELRLEKNITQKMLGEIINANNTTLSNWESRGYEPGYQTLIDLAIFFDVTVGQLLGVEEY